MFNIRTFLLLFLLIIAIGTVSSVAAGDIDNVTVGESNNDGMEVNENNIMAEPIAVDGSNQISAIDSEEVMSQDDSTDVLNANQGKSLSDLQTLINNAARGSTITLTSDYYSDSNSNYRGVLIDKPLTINGNGHIISGADVKGNVHSRVFYITSNNVVLNNIKFIGGYNDKGGAISIECIGNALTTIKNCQFINNTAPHGGGAIITNSRLRIENCKFINNKAQAYDYDSVSGLYTKPAGLGGAIFANYPLQGNQSVYIKDSYFEHNLASYLGGALYLSYVTGDNNIKTGDAESYIIGSTFYNNKATYGGAIANFQYCVITNTQFSENNAMGSGGAIFMADGVYGTIDDEEIVQIFYLMLTGSTKFEMNSASGGGAIGYIPDSYYRSIGLCGIIRTDGNGIVFDSNSASNGGALNILGSDSIIKATFKKNEASQGSVIYGGNIVDSTFTGNSNNLISEGNLIDTGYTSFKFEQSGTYYNDKTLTVTLTNTKRNMPIINTMVGIGFSNGEVVGIETDANGKATYNVPFTVGTYSAIAAVLGGAVNVDRKELDSIKISKAPITITPTKLSTTYDSGKVFQVKVVNSKTKKPVSGIKLKLQVYTGSSSKTVTVTTDSKGIAKYTSASKLSVGTHKVIVSNAQTADCTGSKKTSSIVISKASYNIVAPKVTNPYKVGNFKITVKNKASGKVVSGVSLTVKLYTGSSAKTVTVKTNSKGIATVSTTGLSKANHKIVVSAKSTKYYNAASKTSYANIVAKAATSISYSDLTYYKNPNTNSIFAVSVNLILKDANGNPIKKTITMKHSNGENGFYISDDNNVMAVYCDGTGTLTVKFAGDSNYKPSSRTIKL